MKVRLLLLLIAVVCPTSLARGQFLGIGGTMINSSSAGADVGVIIDGRNNCDDPNDSACLDEGEDSDSADVEDVDDIYVITESGASKYTINNSKDARVVGPDGHFETKGKLANWNDGPVQHPEPAQTWAAGTPEYDALVAALNACAAGQRPFPVHDVPCVVIMSARNLPVGG